MACTVANVNRARGQPPAKVADFLPKFDAPPPQAQTGDQIRKLMLLATLASGGQVPGGPAGAVAGDATGGEPSPASASCPATDVESAGPGG